MISASLNNDRKPVYSLSTSGIHKIIVPFQPEPEIWSELFIFFNRVYRWRIRSPDGKIGKFK